MEATYRWFAGSDFGKGRPLYKSLPHLSEAMRGRAPTIWGNDLGLGTRFDARVMRCSGVAGVVSRSDPVRHVCNALTGCNRSYVWRTFYTPPLMTFDLDSSYRPQCLRVI